MELRTQVFAIKTNGAGIINYSYLVIDMPTREVVFIDPAWEYEKMKKAVENINGHVKAVLLTHSHPDHINLSWRFAEEFNAEVLMGSQEIRDYKFSCKNLRALEDGEQVLFGKSQLQCIHTPGHTSGSVCYYNEDMLFTGDTIFMEGCGICECPGGSPEEMYYSIQKIKSRIKENCRIYPAHCYGTPVGGFFGYVKKNNIYFNIKEKKYFIQFRMRPNQKGLFDFK